MTRRYAEGTTVSVENSRAELERLLRRYGAKKIHNYQDVENGYAAVQFEMRDRLLRFVVEVPPIETFRLDRQGYLRTEIQQRSAWGQEERRRWRVLILSIKAKLEEVESETAPFDTVFMPYIVLPNNQTV